MALYGSSIWNDLSITLRQGNVIVWLISINLGVFILQAVIGMIGFLFMADRAVFETFYQNYFYAPSNLSSLLYHPWTVLTYAFFHADFGIFSLTFFISIGLVEFFKYITVKRGCLTYTFLELLLEAHFISCLTILFPVFEQTKHQAYLLGASGAVWSIIAATMATNPAYRIRLWIIGSVPLWGIVLFMFGRDLLSFQSNPGGILAHFGGMITGFSFVALYRRGYNLIGWMSWPRERITSWRLRSTKSTSIQCSGSATGQLSTQGEKQKILPRGRANRVSKNSLI